MHALTYGFNELDSFIALGLASGKVQPSDLVSLYEKDGQTIFAPYTPPSGQASPALRQAINQACNAKTGDLLLFQFGRESLVHTVMANLRVHVAKKLGLIPEYGSGGVWKFRVCWT